MSEQHSAVGPLADLSAAARRGVDAAELHGAACGVIVGSAGEGSATRLVELLGPDALSDAEAVDQFVAAAATVLLDDDYGFQPLLFDYDASTGVGEDFDLESAGEYLEALAQWCAAFVAGLFAAAPQPVELQELRDGAELPFDLGPDADELIRDLVSIAQVDTDRETLEDLDGNDAEAAFTELLEFTRIAVLMLAAARFGDDDTA
ncbi:MAG: UPF0149 family protein [Pseudomonadota bacterium]